MNLNLPESLFFSKQEGIKPVSLFLAIFKVHIFGKIKQIFFGTWSRMLLFHISIMVMSGFGWSCNCKEPTKEFSIKNSYSNLVLFLSNHDGKFHWSCCERDQGLFSCIDYRRRWEFHHWVLPMLDCLSSWKRLAGTLESNYERQYVMYQSVVPTRKELEWFIKGFIEMGISFKVVVW